MGRHVSVYLAQAAMTNQVTQDMDSIVHIQLHTLGGIVPCVGITELAKGILHTSQIIVSP